MIDYNALGQAIDTSWGRSSTPLTASNSIKMQLVGDGRLKVVYTAVVNFRSNTEFIRMKANYASEAERLIDEVLKRVKEIYKEICGQTLKIKKAASDDSVEIIGLGVYNPKRTAYYRMTELLDIG